MDGHKAIETGNPCWNHPKRLDGSFGPNLDQFPGLVGYLTLLAAAEEPNAVSEYRRQDGNLFSKTDFDAPDKSKVLNALGRSEAPGIKALTMRMIEWCRSGLSSITFEVAVSRCAVSVPDMHPRWVGRPFAAAIPPQISRAETGIPPLVLLPEFKDDGDGQKQDTRPGPDRSHGHQRKQAVVYGLLAVILLIAGPWAYDQLFPEPVRVKCVFTHRPLTRETFDQFIILDADSVVVCHRSHDDREIELKPAKYGYGFIDEKGKLFECYRTGFTVSGP
jgi:hypothetical protein